MIDACVGCDDYRHHLSMLQWAANQISKIARRIRANYRTAKIELMHEARREAYGRISSLVGRIGPSLKWLDLGDSQAASSIDQLSPCIVVCGALMLVNQPLFPP